MKFDHLASWSLGIPHICGPDYFIGALLAFLNFDSIAKTTTGLFQWIAKTYQ